MGQEKGSVLPETAITLPLLILLFGVIFELGSSGQTLLCSKYLIFVGARMASLGASPTEVQKELYALGGLALEITKKPPLAHVQVKRLGSDVQVRLEGLRFHFLPWIASFFPGQKYSETYCLPVENGQPFVH